MSLTFKVETSDMEYMKKRMNELEETLSKKGMGLIAFSKKIKDNILMVDITYQNQNRIFDRLVGKEFEKMISRLDKKAKVKKVDYDEFKQFDSK